MRASSTVLLRIGTPGVYGNDETHLSQPSDVVTSPITGEIFVADGHDSPPANNRIVVYAWYDNEYGYSCQVVRVVQKWAGIRYPLIPSDVTEIGFG